MTSIHHEPVVKTQMFIRRPVGEVFQAFTDPSITTKFWFTKSSGKLEKGKRILWEWEMYGVSDEVYVEESIENKKIVVQFSDSTKTEWSFHEKPYEGTLVSITNYGFHGNEDEIVAKAIDSMGGYTIVLCSLKALLEHNIQLNVVADKAPDAHVQR